MKILLPLAAAALLATNGAAMAKPKPYSITITGVCDHLTITNVNGVYYGASDTSDCDQSTLIGSGTGGTFYAAGDLGFGSTYAWTWTFVLGKKGMGTATLTGTDGTNVFGPSSFDVTYTGKGTSKVPPRNNGLPPAVSVFYKK